MSLSGALTIDDRGLVAGAFRVFQESRPEEERWELVDGVPVMMTPPRIGHQMIAGTLERLLNDALAVHHSSRIAVQRPGLDLGLRAGVLAGIGRADRYVPEPDVAIIDDDPDPGRRIVDTAYLLAEIVSGTDEAPLLSGGRPWIEVKSALYRQHGSCEAVVVIEQDRIEVRLWQRAVEGWTETILRHADDLLDIRCCGLACAVGDLYDRTHLRPRRTPGPKA